MTELTMRAIGVAGRQRLNTAWTLIAILPLPVAVADPDRFWQIIGFAAQALFGTVPIVAIAVFLIALLKATGAENLVAKAFADSRNSGPANINTESIRVIVVSCKACM